MHRNREERRLVLVDLHLSDQIQLPFEASPVFSPLEAGGNEEFSC